MFHLRNVMAGNNWNYGGVSSVTKQNMKTSKSL